MDGANRHCRRLQTPDGSKARPRNVPTSRPLINQGGEGEGSSPASVFTEHLSCAAPEREGFAELVKEGSCTRQRGGRTIWRGEKEKGTLKMENYANQKERGSSERGEGGGGGWEGALTWGHQQEGWQFPTISVRAWDGLHGTWVMSRCLTRAQPGLPTAGHLSSPAVLTPLEMPSAGHEQQQTGVCCDLLHGGVLRTSVTMAMRWQGKKKKKNSLFFSPNLLVFMCH